MALKLYFPAKSEAELASVYEPSLSDIEKWLEQNGYRFVIKNNYEFGQQVQYKGRRGIVINSQNSKNKSVLVAFQDGVVTEFKITDEDSSGLKAGWYYG